jgi:hypothetical protein
MCCREKFCVRDGWDRVGGNDDIGGSKMMEKKV